MGRAMTRWKVCLQFPVFLAMTALSLSGQSKGLETRPNPPTGVATSIVRPLSAPATGSPQEDAAQLRAFEGHILEGKYVEVLPFLRQYLKNNPRSWQAHYDLGYVLFRTHDIRGSIDELARSLELNVNNAQAHKILGLDFMIVEKNDLAKVELQQAVLLKPGSAEMHYFLGRNFMSQSNFSEAKRELEAAVRIDPQFAKAYDNLAVTLDSLGDKDRALQTFRFAIDLSEKQELHSEWPYLDLARFYRAQHEEDLALSCVRKSLVKNPRAPQAYFELAKIHRDREEWGNAAKSVEKAIAIDSYSAEFYYFASQVYQRLGRLEESRRALDKFQQLQNAVGVVPSAGDDSSDAHP